MINTIGMGKEDYVEVLKKGDYVEVLDSDLFLNKPYYKIEDIFSGYMASHPILIIDDYGNRRWLKLDDIKRIKDKRNDTIDDILK